MKKSIVVRINEIEQKVSPDCRVGDIRRRFKPDADILIRNGCPCSPKEKIKAGDRIIFIRRGEIPKPQELEALLTARHTPGVHEKIKKAVVGIAGLGGLGSSVAVSLARMGVGTLIGADFDVVEPSNLNRQQYCLDHIGMAKVEAMQNIIEGITPLTRFAGRKIKLDEVNIPEVFASAQVVVECFDNAEAKVMLLESMGEFLPEVYCIAASGVAGSGDSNRILTRKMGDRLFVVGDLQTSARPGRGLMAPRVGVAAHHQANLAVELLTDPQKAIDDLPEITG